MKKTLLISWANIRKTKGHTVSLFIMFFIAALLCNAGLLIFLNFGDFFHKTVEELNTAGTYYIMPSSMYTDEVKDYFNSHENIIDSQDEELLWAKSELQYGKTYRELSIAFNDADKERNLSKWKFVGKHLPADDMSIYLPYIFELSGGYELGDTIELDLKDTTLKFTIKGFIEDIYFSSLETGLMGVYLPHATYETVKATLGEDYGATLVFANQYETNSDVENGLRELGATPSMMTDITSGLFSIDLPLVELARIMMASMVSIMIVVFAAIIVLVSLIVVRFRIGISIIDDMTKIGSLKAIGYTSRQISSSIALQFVLIALAGGIGGIIGSYLVLPALSDVFATQSGLMWEQGFDITISLITLGVILLVTLLVAYQASRKINKLNPIVALRGGIITHSFRKNPVPLHKSKGKLSFVLAAKSILQNKRQSVMIAGILIAVSFAGSFAVVMFYNTTVETKAFAETPGIELSNVVAIRNPEVDKTEFLQELSSIEGVRKTQYIDEASVMIEKNEVTVYVMEDFSTKETNTIYEGRYPIHENEIVLAGRLSELIHKSVGDMVTVMVGTNQADYLITGLSQGSSMGGMNASLQLDGYRMIQPGFEPMNLQVYLEDTKAKSADIVTLLESNYQDKIVSALDLDKYMELGMGVYINIVSKVGIVILVVTIAVVVLVLYFVLNSSVVRKKRELGIQKAIGFTTLQLMNQLSLSFLPPVIIGVCIGNIIGISQSNSIMTMAQKAMGIMKAGYVVKPNWILMFGCIVVVISYLTSLLITYRIRKISAYALVSE